MEIGKDTILNMIGTLHVTIELAKAKGYSPLRMSAEEDNEILEVINSQMNQCEIEVNKLGEKALTFREQIKKDAVRMNSDVIEKSNTVFKLIEKALNENLHDCVSIFNVDVEYTLAYIKARRSALSNATSIITKRIDEIFDNLVIQEASVKKPRLLS